MNTVKEREIMITEVTKNISKEKACYLIVLTKQDETKEFNLVKSFEGVKRLLEEYLSIYSFNEKMSLKVYEFDSYKCHEIILKHNYQSIRLNDIYHI